MQIYEICNRVKNEAFIVSFDSYTRGLPNPHYQCWETSDISQCRQQDRNEHRARNDMYALRYQNSIDIYMKNGSCDIVKHCQTSDKPNINLVMNNRLLSSESWDYYLGICNPTCRCTNGVGFKLEISRQSFG